jgi:hypothetical protein
MYVIKNEYCRKNHCNSRRASDYQPLVAREKYSLTFGAEGTGYSIVSFGVSPRISKLIDKAVKIPILT